MRNESTAIPTAFLAAAERVETILDSKAVVAHWEDQSALEGYTVAGLAGHLARGVLTVEQYMDAPEPSNTTEATDAAGYITAVLGDHDPVDSGLHRGVRARSLDASKAGASALAREVGHARLRLQGSLDESIMERRIEALQGVVITVEEYLRTRLVELVVHLDDLAVSVGEEDSMDLPQGAYDEAAVVLVQVAVRRHGALSVIRGLARRERHPEAIRAF
ncbi:maleylpyruvate isomerase N-terminal domain-containing protein [Arthrobacter sedimenti]|uniref:maleylpyruvate isomerase N-terminal domain-containing protein n=1 Tax=Arthrobacter sedimenti TaxID=2694931 RepID=UPI000B361822|nr:maleylpyruvate isomerase N-terminal domain-containing protein [Arthrobacter sedimenti]OUM39436.1 hypothetical protein B8W73_13170 [Arthrobacter agilis]